MIDLSASEAQQELILERLLHPRRPSRLKRGLVTLAVCAALASLSWALSALKPPLPSLSLWDLRDAERMTLWGRHATDRCLIQASAFLLLGAAAGLIAARLLPRRPRPTRPDPPVDRPADRRVDQRAGTAERTAKGVLRTRGTGPQAAVPQAQAQTQTQVRAPGEHRHPLGHRTTPRPVRRVLVGLFGHVLAGAGLLVGTLAIAGGLGWALVDSAGWSLALDVATAAVGLCLGLWLAWWLAHGWRGCAAVLLHVAVATVLVAAVGSWLTTRLLAEQPFPFSQAAVTSVDKRRLVDVLTEKSEVVGDERVYHVTEEQVNQLLAWWFSVQSIDGKARLALGDHQQEIWCSLRLPESLHLARPHVNVSAVGQCTITSERLELDVPALEIGGCRLPAAVTQWLSRHVTHWINADPRNRALLVGVTAAHARSDGVEVLLKRHSNRRRLSQLYAQLNDVPDVTAAVAQHLAQFSQIAARAKRQDPVFEMIVKSAFTTARQRSRFRDPVLENRAAILALGIALGHTNLAVFVGELDDAMLYGPVARLPHISRLRGRSDWVRHFWVSAALALVANHRVSDAAGLLKEELDADTGGSGFSFADLAADRAGTEFAQQATASRDAARRVQYWVLNETTDLDELMPPADDLPEGMSDADLLEHFDGVGGARFTQMLDGIEERIQQLPWWTAVER